jgi:hypothetical protein
MKKRKQAVDDRMNYRTMPLGLRADGAPSTLNADARSVEVVGATEQPVDVFDFERWEVVSEVLLMAGCEMPKNRQVPLLDTHWRGDTTSVLGSYRDMAVADDQLTGLVVFSSVAEAEAPFTKLREGHLTDFSVGYRPVESTWVPDGEKAVIKGRSFDGPVKVTTRWRLKELSICPVGADELAKARSEHANHKKTGQESGQKEIRKMNKHLRKYLEGRGLAVEATEDEAWGFYVKQLAESTPAPAAPAAPVEPADIERAAAEAVRLERERVGEIRGMCRHHGLDKLGDRLVADGVSVEDSRKAVLEAIRTDANPAPPSQPAELLRDERDKFRAAAQDALIIRVGGPRPETLAPGAEDLAGFTLVEMARTALRMANQKTGGNIMDMVGRAMQTADFPLLLSAAANKMLFAGWDSAEETWDQWVDDGGSVSDFKTHQSLSASEADGLDEIPENVPYKYGTRTEAREQFSIATYGKLFAITRQAIINDDLSALSDIPRFHGEAAKRRLGDLAYAILTANAAMGDGVNLFHANHSNLVAAGAGAAPGVVTIAAGILAMGLQLDIRGLRRLNIRPQYFIAPKTLEGVSEVFFRSERFSDHQVVPVESGFASTRVNPYAGTYFTRVYDARLDSTSTTAWYLAAAKGKTVKMFFLNGVKTPYLETKQGWSVDGVEYKVRIDAGAKALDWRGLYANAGV